MSFELHLASESRLLYNYITLLLITVARASLMVSTPSLREAAQSERRVSSLALPSQSSIDGVKSFLRWYFIVSAVRKRRAAISSVV